MNTLRRELRVHDAGYDAGGEPTYVVYDPFRHTFFRITEKALAFLAHGGKAESGIAEFLEQSRMVTAPTGGTATLIEEHARTHGTIFRRILHGYLFFRIPLFDPTASLNMLLPLARHLASRAALCLISFVAILAIYLTGRQWDTYAANLANALSLQGALSFGVTLMVLKVFHEFGHGLVARAHGCRVPVMGVAFMLLAPMLYTDVTDSWRLKSPKARFSIAAAGIAVELALAAVSLLLWAVMLDGPWRSVMFFVSSTAWISSVMINMSPFMRFDGYHMLGDAMRMHNLGPRAMAQAMWRLREMLFCLDEIPPEQLPRHLSRFLTAFAWGTIIYRLFLFLGIAYLVYVMFPKAVGLPLALIEVQIFIIKPVLRELAVWRSFGFARLFRPLQARLNLLVIIALGFLCLMPLDRHVSMPAVLRPALETTVYPPEAAMVKQTSLVSGSRVTKGEILAVLQAPAITFQQEQVALRLAIIDTKLERIAAGPRERAKMQVLAQDRKALAEELAGLEARASRLVITAPIEGVVNAVSRGLAPGNWLAPDQPLAHIAGTSGVHAVALANEADVARLIEGTSAVFIADDGAQASRHMQLVMIGTPNSAGSEITYLSSEHGGPVPVGQDASGKDRALVAVLPALFYANGDNPTQAVLGRILALAEPQSLARQFFSRLLAVLLRESGF